MWIDHWVVICLIPLALWMLLSGLDDLFIGLAYLLNRRPVVLPPETELETAPERRIAIFVPLWNEHGVIGKMLERNLAVLRYSNYVVFAGVYPNDQLTRRAVAEAAASDPRVQMTLCGNEGPTSKGDNLNWIYRGMREYESRHGIRFELVVTHDAEDLIHPDSLRWINRLSRDYAMVQIPVLPLPTPFREFTHGLYCDEFAEYQTKDIPVRQALGGFLPSNGVGTGFSREALDRLAAERGGQIFDPRCLTEDYENGYRIFRLGRPQIFLPVRFDAGGPVATREYFPRSWLGAVRQRSRWVAGIALQGWEHHGWRGSGRQAYWFWRDRKGLIGNLISPAANLILVYGLTRQSSSIFTSWFPHLWAANLTIAAILTGMRMRAGARIYGWRFAAGVPLRMLWGNAINFLATANALQQFFAARLQKRRLAWRKTEHLYPVHSAASEVRPRLGELLVRMKCISTRDLSMALESLPPGVRLGEYLVRSQHVREEYVYQALSVQAGVPAGYTRASEIDAQATRILPAEFVRRWKVLPYRVALGQLHVLTSEVPSEALIREVSTLSHLAVRFRLVPPSQILQYQRTFIPAPRE